MILFLDFDGVLHPDAVYLQRGRPELRTEGSLFMWAPQLIEALRPYPGLRIVLSTSWVEWRGYRRTRAELPEVLQSRVIGATWHSRVDPVEWQMLTRYEQIRRYLGNRQESWLALDDDNADWADADRQRLVWCNGETGIGNPETRARLQRVLAEGSQGGSP